MSIYTPYSVPMPSIENLEAKCQSLMVEYKEHLKLIQAEYSDAKKQTYMTDPKTICFKYEGKTREECLLDEWNREIAMVTASSERKKKRLDDARIICDVERAFQAQHCFIHAKVSEEESLCGYYKVTRHPDHYSFVLKRNATTYKPWPIGKETILPITLDMSGDDWCYVAREKIHTP